MTPEEWAEKARVKMGLAPNLKARWEACAAVIRAAEADAYADGWRKGAEAGRAAVALAFTFEQGGPYAWGRDDVMARIRALPIPEPPGQKGE